MPRVSVLIPAYKAEAFIAHAVASALNQTFGDLEIVIAADDGVDYLKLLAGKGTVDTRLRQVATGGMGSGVAKARNCALGAARGSIIATLDSDDRLAPDALERLLPQAEKHGAAYSDIELLDFASGHPLPNCNRKLPEGVHTLDEIFKSNMHTYAWIVFDRARLPGLAWPESPPILDDVMLVASVCDALGGMHYSPLPLYAYYRREGSVCNSPGGEETILQSTCQLLEALDKKTLAYANPSTVISVREYFRQRGVIKTRFFEAMQKGECRDYYDFMDKNRTLLYAM